MKKLIGFLFIFLVFIPSVFSEEDGLSNDDNPPGLQEYLKQLENQKKSKSGFHVYSDEGKEALQSDMGSDFVPIQKRTQKEMGREDKLRRQRTLSVKKVAAQEFRKSREEMMNKLFKDKFERESFIERARRRHDMVENQSKLFLEGVNNADVFANDKKPKTESIETEITPQSVISSVDLYSPGAPPKPRMVHSKRIKTRRVAQRKMEDILKQDEEAKKKIPELKATLQVFKPKERMQRTSVDLIEGLEFPQGTDPFLALIDSENALRDDEISKARVKLGESLFHDKNLSVDRKVSCASCHNPDMNFMDGQRFPVGVERRIAGGLNTPSINNVIFRKRLFWDGRADGLEKMSLMPFMNPREMGMKNKEEIVSRVQEDRRRYGQLFEDAYDGEISEDTIGRAIASFQRTLIIGNSKVDKFLSGDFQALDPEEKRGFEIFTSKGKCVACHRLEHDFAGPVDSDHRVSTGLFQDVPVDKKFVIPTLRNISRTGPYFHDGRSATLKEVIEIYDKGAVHESDKVSEMTREPLNLTLKEKEELLKFLKALDSYPIKQKLN
ncbi:MAG: c-type cytochrome [Deltaproteobacteria bacterium]|nr:MAG: c-type cytochrome [Deltaproteobacteria bacterium]